MSARTCLKLCVIVLLLSAAGCGEQAVQTNSGPYRTVNVEPLRDTPTARKYHAKGVKHLEADDVDAAIKDFQRALEADVEFGPAHNSLGRAYFMQERFYEAAWEFEYAHKQLPRAPEPLNNLGLIHERDRSYDRAIEYYRKAVERAPDNIRMKANLARAMIRRGDRTKEVHNLLQQILERDDRPDWLIWAKRWESRIDPED